MTDIRRATDLVDCPEVAPTDMEYDYDAIAMDVRRLQYVPPKLEVEIKPKAAEEETWLGKAATKIGDLFRSIPPYI